MYWKDGVDYFRAGKQDAEDGRARRRDVPGCYEAEYLAGYREGAREVEESTSRAWNQAIDRRRS